MVFRLSIALGILGLAACIPCLAQEQEKTMLERIDQSRNKAMVAVKTNKKDPSLASPLGGLEFKGSSDAALKNKKAAAMDFRYDQKVSSDDYKMVRSFFGLKNPWIGRKVYVAEKANVFSKSLIPNADREVEAGKSLTREYYQAEKVVKTGDEIVKTQPFLGKGAAQGAMDKLGERVGQDMTIDEVRELLNKGQ